MTSDHVVSYVGDSDFHDGGIVSVVADGNLAPVVVRGASGNEYAVEFYGVKKVQSNRPEGMMLYALTEMRTDTSARRFVFSNWEYDDDACLAVEAEGFSVTSVK
jgi:hypothetical protein